MPVVAVRVWLPDRPGALGAVASRLGAVGGDVIGIDIIERGAGRAVDELVVELPEDGLTDLVTYTNHRADETVLDAVCRLLLEKNK